MKSLFKADYSVDAGPAEPDNARDLNRLLVEHAFADSWARPQMEPRTKSLITIAMMVALGQSDELRAHVKGALILGVSKEEIVEVLIHTLVYCGAPRTGAAWSIVRKVFAGWPPPARDGG
jgi:4-carboxymuconolactone decarboxylase